MTRKDLTFWGPSQVETKDLPWPRPGDIEKPDFTTVVSATVMLPPAPNFIKLDPGRQYSVYVQTPAYSTVLPGVYRVTVEPPMTDEVRAAYCGFANVRDMKLALGEE